MTPAQRTVAEQLIERDNDTVAIEDLFDRLHEGLKDARLTDPEWEALEDAVISWALEQLRAARARPMRASR